MIQKQTKVINIGDLVRYTASRGVVIPCNSIGLVIELHPNYYDPYAVVHWLWSDRKAQDAIDLCWLEAL